MSLKAKAYAKINLFLDVLGKRDDGYHEIDTVMQNISVYDEISLELIENGIDIACDVDDISGENNIVYNACKEFLTITDKKIGVKVFIKKNIPLAAGLGGGSSDAAAVLNLLNIAFGNVLDYENLHSIASKLGADVPFFLKGGTARATGIGDILSDLSAPQMHFVLVKDGVKQSTGAMYKHLDASNIITNKSSSDLISALSANNLSLVSNAVYNKFELCWDFVDISKPFKNTNALKVFLSGSGPTVCALFEDSSQAILCAERLKKDGYNAYYASTVKFGMELV